MRVFRQRNVQKRCQVGLPRRGRQEVITADHLVNALGRIVHHHRKVVGGDTVVAAEHEVVNHARIFSVQHIPDGVLLDACPQPDGRRPGGPLEFQFGSIEVPAGPRIRTLRSMRSGRRFLDFPARAVALVRQACLLKAPDGVLVERPAGSLPYRIPVPCHADGRQVPQLQRFRARPRPVQVLHPEQEPAPAGPGKQPRQDGGPQVADMKLTGRAGGEAAGGSHGSSLSGNSTRAPQLPMVRASGDRWLRGSCREKRAE